MKLSIHQPDFFPWLGLFHKIVHSERFVVFDHVQAPRGKSWLTRNRILLNGEPRWMTLPVHRKGLQPIYAVEVNYEVNFKPKHLGTLRQAYQKANFFAEIFPFVENLYADSPRTVQEFTLRAIKEICSSLGIGTEFVLSSEIVSKNPDLSNLGANELVLELCIHAEASFYISGIGCLDFIRPETFAEKGMEFYFQVFSTSPYVQAHGEPFVSHMSVLDALFNLGFSGTAELLTSPMLKSASEYFSDIGEKDFG